MGDQRAGFPQAESHLAEQALTLPHTQVNIMKLFQVMGEDFSVPEILRVSKLPWVSPQITIDGFPLGIAKTSRPALPFAFMQSSETAVLKTLHPAFNSTRILPEDIGYVITVKPVSNQEDAMQPVIVAGFLRAQDFLLHCNPHDLRIRDLQFTHARALLHHNMAGGADESNVIMRHYLCRSV
jgi:hypothetical protein